MAQLHLKHFITWFHLHLIILFFFLLLHGGADAQSSMQPVPTYISHHTWEPSFAITLGAVICAVLFMGIIAIYVRKCAQSHIITSTNRTSSSSSSSECSCSCSQGITKELLNTFPILFYPTIKDLKIGKGSLECAVCLTDFKDCDTLRLLPKCDHVFHPQCIDSWLCSHVTCPVCRANLNQDSCEVSVTVLPTQLSTSQRVDESSGTEAGEQQNGGGDGGEENEVLEQNPQVVENEVQVKIDDGVAPKSKLLRSNSTGHSLVEQGKSEETQERFTLRLPEDVRRYILVNNGGRVHRSASYNNNNNNSNMVRGLCWSDSEGSSKGKNLWVLWSRG